MSDRELLELAAKAAGIGGGWGDRLEYHNGAVDLSDMWILDQEEFCPWNPLMDDGDALRLAVSLKMDIKIGTYDTTAEGHVNGVLGYTAEFIEADAAASTRRAIVRAAAEIGKSL